MTTSLPELILSSLHALALEALVDQSAPTPRRSFVSHGPPPIDLQAAATGVGEDLRVHVYSGTISARPFGERRAGSPGEQQIVGMTTVMPCIIELWECYPNLNDAGSAPEPATITAASLALAKWAWAIWTELCSERDAGTLFAAADTGQSVVAREDIGIGSMTPLPPSGYMAGWRITLEVGMAARFS